MNFANRPGCCLDLAHDPRLIGKVTPQPELNRLLTGNAEEHYFRLGVIIQRPSIRVRFRFSSSVSPFP